MRGFRAGFETGRWKTADLLYLAAELQTISYSILYLVNS